MLWQILTHIAMSFYLNRKNSYLIGNLHWMRWEWVMFRWECIRIRIWMDQHFKIVIDCAGETRDVKRKPRYMNCILNVWLLFSIKINNLQTQTNRISNTVVSFWVLFWHFNFRFLNVGRRLTHTTCVNSQRIGFYRDRLFRVTRY